MDPWSFIQTLPTIALALIGFVIALALWMLWRNIAPAAPGVSLGYYEVLGRYAGRKLVKRIRGTLVDCTPIFMNPEIGAQFRQILIEDINARKGNPTEKDDDLDMLTQNLKSESFQNLCRIIATRDRFVHKHIIIQYGAIDKPLNAFASNDPSSKFTLGFGFLSQGIITGEIFTLPQPLKIHNLGKVQVHLFKPDASHDMKTVDSPEWMPKLVLYAPAIVDYAKQTKALNDRLVQREREFDKMVVQYKAVATERDALYRIVQGMSETGEIPKELLPRHFDLMDFIMLSAPTIIGYFAAENFAAPPIVGVFAGLFVGAFIVLRRK